MDQDKQADHLEDEKIQQKIKEAEVQKEVRKYCINTGDIFIELQKSFESYDGAFLQDEVKDALEESLITQYNTQLGNDADRHNLDYLLRNAAELKAATEEAGNSGRLFFPDFFIHYYLGKPVRLINYGEENILFREDPSFDLFYSLKLSQLKLKEVSHFLQYHLETSFENSLSSYRSFLEKILLIYASILSEATPLVNYFLNELPAESGVVVEPHEDETPKLNLQVLAMHYIFQELGVDTSTIDMTALTSLTQFITNRQVNLPPKNTRIYKFLKKPLYKSDESMIEDLQIIRIYFEKIKLPNIVARINKEISGLQVG